MCRSLIPVLLLCLVTTAHAQEGSGVPNTGSPTNEKAQKTFPEGLEYLRKHNSESALARFKKADKQDGGRCLACQKEIATLGLELRDWKSACRTSARSRRSSANSL